MSYRSIAGLLLSLSASGCAFSHANYLKQMKKLDAAAYSKIQVGEVQNFTAVKVHVFNRQWNAELSNADDPRIQAQFSNQGSTLYYSDNITGKPWKFSSRPMPSSISGEWDKFAVLDEDSVAANYVSVNTDRDFIAKITDNGAVVAYKDAALDLLFHQRPLPAGVDKTWDTYFTTDNDMYGLFRSSTADAYRFGYVDPKTGKLLSFDFQPLGWGLQSSRYGIYRGIGYHLVLREWFVYDFLPTQKLICFDLARAYDAAAGEAKRQTANAALQAILMALAGYSTGSFSGVGTSTYNGYYAGNSFTASGTTVYSGYAQTYDYRYLAAGASSLLDTIFRGTGTIDNIKAAMREQNCGFDS